MLTKCLFWCLLFIFQVTTTCRLESSHSCGSRKKQKGRSWRRSCEKRCRPIRCVTCTVPAPVLHVVHTTYYIQVPLCCWTSPSAAECGCDTPVLNLVNGQELVRCTLCGFLQSQQHHSEPDLLQNCCSTLVTDAGGMDEMKSIKLIQKRRFLCGI